MDRDGSLGLLGRGEAALQVPGGIQIGRGERVGRRLQLVRPGDANYRRLLIPQPPPIATTTTTMIRMMSQVLMSLPPGVSSATSFADAAGQAATAGAGAAPYFDVGFNGLGAGGLGFNGLGAGGLGAGAACTCGWSAFLVWGPTMPST